MSSRCVVSHISATNDTGVDRELGYEPETLSEGKMSPCSFTGLVISKLA